MSEKEMFNTVAWFAGVWFGFHHYQAHPIIGALLGGVVAGWVANFAYDALKW